MRSYHPNLKDNLKDILSGNLTSIQMYHPSYPKVMLVTTSVPTFCVKSVHENLIPANVFGKSVQSQLRAKLPKQYLFSIAFYSKSVTLNLFNF